MRILVAAVLIVFYHTVAFAGTIETVLMTPTGTPQAGQNMVFSVFFNNTGDNETLVNLPIRVHCVLKSSDQRVETVASLLQPASVESFRICGKCFEKVRYSLTLPQTLNGPVSMKISDLDGAAMMFRVDAELPQPEAVESVTSDSQEFETLDSLFELYQPYLKNLAAYEPMYFLIGTDPEDSKFQVSFKYRFFNDKGTLAQKYPWVKGLHFGYTQTSFWDLKSASEPFEDTSYKPEFFFLSSKIKTRFPWLRPFLQTGFQHESNGRGGEDSRSTNYIYVKPIFINYQEKNRLGIMVAPKVWAYVNNDDQTNSDLKDYRGYFDLEVKLGNADSFVLGSHFRWAKEGGSMALDLTYPLHRFFNGNIGLYFQVEYVNALAESLLNYKERTEAVRLGFAIVR
jgi:outer membrane phospholipase A